MKLIRPCTYSPPGAPCPCHDRGTWPQECVCYLESNGRLPLAPRVGIVLVGAILFTAIVLVLFSITARAADNVQPCMTKEQARAKYPGQWIYWHTANRCWDNIKVSHASRHTYSVNRNSMQLGKPPIDASGNALHHSAKALTQDEIDEMQYRMEAERRLESCCWPPPPMPFVPWDLRINGEVE